MTITEQPTSVVSPNLVPKAYIWTPDDDNLHDNALAWSEFEMDIRQNNYQVIPIESPNFAEIEPDAKLILLCHGSDSNKLKNEMDLEDVENNQTIQFSQALDRGIPDPNRVDKSATQLAEYLKLNGLKANHKVIEMASCNSNFFAKGLQKALKDLEYDNVTVFGYHGPFLEPNVFFNEGLANLDKEVMNGDNVRSNTYVFSSINNSYDARLAKVGYGDNILVEANRSLRKALCQARNLDLSYLDEDAKPPIKKNNFTIKRKRPTPVEKKAQEAVENAEREANNDHPYATRRKSKQSSAVLNSSSGFTSQHYINEPSSDLKIKNNKDIDLELDALLEKNLDELPISLKAQIKEKKDPKSPKPH